MIEFECRWRNGALAIRLSAMDATQAGQEAAQVIAEFHVLPHTPVLATRLTDRSVGLYQPVTGELLAFITTRPAPFELL